MPETVWLIFRGHSADLVAVVSDEATAWSVVREYRTTRGKGFAPYRTPAWAEEWNTDGSGPTHRKIGDLDD